MQNQASRVLLEQARHHFESHDFSLAKQKLNQLNEQQLSTTLNILLTELAIGNRESEKQILKKLLNLLTSTNIQLYQKNRPKKINFISHEVLYWNIVSLAQSLGQTEVGELVGNQALFFYKSFRPSTSLKIILEMLKNCLSENRLSSCFALLEKFEKVIDHHRKMNAEESKLKVMINIMFTRVLIKLQMIKEGQAIYMLKFGEAEKEFFLEEEKQNKKKEQFLPYSQILNFLHTQIEFFSHNYEKCLHLLSQNIQQKPCWEKGCLENNLGLIMCMNGKYSAAQKLFTSSASTFYKIINQGKKVNHQTVCLYERVRENLILAHLISRDSKQTGTHSSLEYDQKYYTQIKAIHEVHSYKEYYRRAEVCLNFYHSLLEKANRKLPYEEIYDNYDTVYYHPNQPYYQFKGRNKNIYQASKRQVHRRYAMNEWSSHPQEEVVDKDVNRKKFEKQAAALKLKELVDQAYAYLKKSLMILEKEKQIIISLEGTEKEKVQNISQRLYHEYVKFQSSILCLLTYVSLCRCDWNSVIRFANQFQQKKCAQISSQSFYSVLAYKMEAYCELDRHEDAYKVVHELHSCGVSKAQVMTCRDGSNLNNCVFEKQQSAETNFLFNLAVLHIRNNKIAESYQAIQKLFTEVNKIPNNPKANFPLPIIELLIHYNLRINNVNSALQMIKRRRILGGSTNTISKPVLNITK